MTTLVVEQWGGCIGVLLGVAAGTSLPLGLLLGYWVIVDVVNLRVIRGMVASPSPLQDGATVAFEGVVRVDGPPMQSPFTDTPCAAYTYVVAVSRRAIRGGTRRVVLAQGFHLKPTRLDGSARSLRLAALPGFEVDLRNNERGTAWGPQVRALFEHLSGTAGPAGDAAREIELIRARQGIAEEIHRDYLMGIPGEYGGSLVVDEEVLPAGERVCAIGAYDASTQRLTARRGRLGPNLMIYRGSAAEVLARVGRDTRWFVMAVAVLLGIGLTVSLASLVG